MVVRVYWGLIKLGHTDCQSKGRDEGVSDYGTGGEGGCGAVAGMFPFSTRLMMG